MTTRSYYFGYIDKRTREPCVCYSDVGSGNLLCPLPLRLDLRDHSPTGFQWGYGGSGPAQLALAILADYLGDEQALEIYQSFKWKVIAKLPRGKQWELTVEQIDASLAAIATEA